MQSHLMKFKFIPLVFGLLLLLCAIPFRALADTTDTVTTAAYQTNYLQYNNNGVWTDLTIPKYTTKTGGIVCYPLEQSASAPTASASYSEGALSGSYSSYITKGLQIIFQNGYPSVTPTGMSADEARQATTYAVLFWIAEQGSAGSYSYMNRLADTSSVRAKTDHENILQFADSLLALARAQELLDLDISLNKENARVSYRSADATVGYDDIQINLGDAKSYTYTKSGEPSNSTFSGFTGTKSETMSFSVPFSINEIAITPFTVTMTFTGHDGRAPSNAVLYTPVSGSSTKMLACKTTPADTNSITFTLVSTGFGRTSLKGTNYDVSSQGDIPNVELDIYWDKACTEFIQTISTGSSAIWESSYMPVNRYYVKCRSVAEPFVACFDSDFFVVNPNGNSSFYFEFRAQKVILNLSATAQQVTSLTAGTSKYGSVYTPVMTSVALPGVEFEITSGTNTTNTVTSGADGKATQKNLKLGTISVKEKTVPAGYILNETAQSANVTYTNFRERTQTVSKTFINSRIPAYVKLKQVSEKYNETTGSFESCAGSGYVYGLYSADVIGIIPKDTLLDILTTGSDGVATSDAPLPFGNYYLKQLATPETTIQVKAESFPLTLSGTGASVTNTTYFDTPISNSMFHGNIAIWVADSKDASKHLSGAVYEIRKASDNSLVDTLTTGANGYAVSKSLPVGEYKLKEKTAPTGYLLSDKETDVSLTIQDKSTLSFDLTNAKSSIQLTKKDASTGKGIPGVKMEIKDSSGNLFGTYTTDESGTISIDGIPAGTYSYKLTDVPKGYASADSGSFTVTASGTVTGYTQSSMEPTALKISAQNEFLEEAFSGLSYTILDADGKVVKTAADTAGYRVVSATGDESFATDDQGLAEVRYLGAGSYTLKENTPQGYITSAPFSFDISSSTTSTDPCTVSSSLTLTGVTVINQDASTENPLSGVAFQVKQASGAGFVNLTFSERADGTLLCDPEGTLTSLMSDGSGRISILGLPVDKLWLDQSVSPDGYFPVSAIRIDVDSESTAATPKEVTIQHSEYIKLGVNSDWWEFPLLIFVSLGLIGLVVFFVIRKKKQGEYMAG